MTTFEGTSASFGAQHEFKLLREHLWAAFYRMSFRDRAATLLDESAVFIMFACGIVLYSYLTPYAQRVVELFDMAAYAQTAAPQFLGLSKADCRRRTSHSPR